MSKDSVSVASLMFARLWLYQLFHKLIGGRPTKDMLVWLGSETTKDALEEYSRESANIKGFAEMCGSFADGIDDHKLDAVMGEHNRMFANLGRPGLITWESASTSPDESLFGDTAILIRELYQKWGWRAVRKGSVPEDSLAMMLGFCSILAHADLDDLLAGNNERLPSRLADEALINEGHMLNWIPDEVERAFPSKETFYGKTLGALVAFLRIDAVFVRNVLVWLRESGSHEVSFDDEALSARFSYLGERFGELAELKVPFLEDMELVSI